MGIVLGVSYDQQLSRFTHTHIHEHTCSIALILTLILLVFDRLLVKIVTGKYLHDITHIL